MHQTDWGNQWRGWKRCTLISLNIRVTGKDEVNSISLKKRKNMDSSFCISLSTCIVPEPTATKRALEICPEALDNVSEKFRVM